MDSVLGHKPATQPPVIVDSSAETEDVCDDDVESGVETNAIEETGDSELESGSTLKRTVKK